MWQCCWEPERSRTFLQVPAGSNYCSWTVPQPRYPCLPTVIPSDLTPLRRFTARSFHLYLFWTVELFFWGKRDGAPSLLPSNPASPWDPAPWRIPVDKLVLFRVIFTSLSPPRDYKVTMEGRGLWWRRRLIYLKHITASTGWFCRFLLARRHNGNCVWVT